MPQNVLIVGAGPVGLTMALELARYGVSVTIVDKAAERTCTSRALIIWSRTLELLDRADCAQALVEAGRALTAANIFAGRRRLARVGFGGDIDPLSLCADASPERDRTDIGGASRGVWCEGRTYDRSGRYRPNR